MKRSVFCRALDFDLYQPLMNRNWFIAAFILYAFMTSFMLEICWKVFYTILQKYDGQWPFARLHANISFTARKQVRMWIVDSWRVEISLLHSQFKVSWTAFPLPAAILFASFCVWYCSAASTITYYCLDLLMQTILKVPPAGK